METTIKKGQYTSVETSISYLDTKISSQIQVFDEVDFVKSLNRICSFDSLKKVTLVSNSHGEIFFLFPEIYTLLHKLESKVSVEIFSYQNLLPFIRKDIPKTWKTSLYVEKNLISSINELFVSKGSKGSDLNLAIRQKKDQLSRYLQNVQALLNKQLSEREAKFCSYKKQELEELFANIQKNNLEVFFKILLKILNTPQLLNYLKYPDAMVYLSDFFMLFYDSDIVKEVYLAYMLAVAIVSSSPCFASRLLFVETDKEVYFYDFSRVNSSCIQHTPIPSSGHYFYGVLQENEEELYRKWDCKNFFESQDAQEKKNKIKEHVDDLKHFAWIEAPFFSSNDFVELCLQDEEKNEKDLDSFNVKRNFCFISNAPTFLNGGVAQKIKQEMLKQPESKRYRFLHFSLFEPEEYSQTESYFIDEERRYLESFFHVPANFNEIEKIQKTKQELDTLFFQSSFFALSFVAKAHSNVSLAELLSLFIYFQIYKKKCGGNLASASVENGALWIKVNNKKIVQILEANQISILDDLITLSDFAMLCNSEKSENAQEFFKNLSIDIFSQRKQGEIIKESLSALDSVFLGFVDYICPFLPRQSMRYAIPDNAILSWLHCFVSFFCERNKEKELRTLFIRNFGWFCLASLDNARVKKTLRLSHNALTYLGFKVANDGRIGHFLSRKPSQEDIDEVCRRALEISVCIDRVLNKEKMRELFSDSSIDTALILSKKDFREKCPMKWSNNRMLFTKMFKKELQRKNIDNSLVDVLDENGEDDYFAFLMEFYLQSQDVLELIQTHAVNASKNPHTSINTYPKPVYTHFASFDFNIVASPLYYDGCLKDPNYFYDFYGRDFVLKRIFEYINLGLLATPKGSAITNFLIFKAPSKIVEYFERLDAGEAILAYNDALDALDNLSRGLYFRNKREESSNQVEILLDCLEKIANHNLEVMSIKNLNQDSPKIPPFIGKLVINTYPKNGMHLG